MLTSRQSIVAARTSCVAGIPHLPVQYPSN
jgi:hypothetical protein